MRDYLQPSELKAQPPKMAQKAQPTIPKVEHNHIKTAEHNTIENIPHFFPHKDFAILGKISTYLRRRSRHVDSLIRAFEVVVQRNRYLAVFFIAAKLILSLVGVFNFITYSIEKIYIFVRFLFLFFKKKFFNMNTEAKNLSTLTIKVNTDESKLLHETRIIYSFEVENDDGVKKNALNYSVLDLFATQIEQLIIQHFEEVIEKNSGTPDAISFSLSAFKSSAEEAAFFEERYPLVGYGVVYSDLPERLNEFLEYLLFYLEHREVVHIVVAFHTKAVIDLSPLQAVLVYKKAPKDGVVPKKDPNTVYFDPPF